MEKQECSHRWEEMYWQICLRTLLLCRRASGMLSALWGLSVTPRCLSMKTGKSVCVFDAVWTHVLCSRLCP